MKHIIKLLCLLLCLLPVGAAGEMLDWDEVPRTPTSHFTYRRATDWEDYQEYEIDEIYITGYIGDAEIVRVPDTIAGMPVTGMKSEIFTGNTEITHVYLPDTLETDFLSRCFEGCTNLVQVHLPASCTTVPNGMFDNCRSLQYVDIPAGLIAIGGQAFWGCRQLESLDLPEGMKTIYGAAFHGCTSLKELGIPSTVDAIHRQAFEESGIVTIDVSSVGYLGSMCFQDCKELTTVRIADKLGHYNSPEVDLFVGCESLADVQVVEGNCTMTLERLDEIIEGYEIDEIEIRTVTKQGNTLYWGDDVWMTVPDGE